MLSKEPWEAIEKAVDDLEKAEADPLYIIKMDNWHEMNYEGKCEVCFAGSVMAFTLGANIHKELDPSNFGYDTRLKLNAIDSFREGYWSRGLQTWGLTEDIADHVEGLINMNIPDYKRNRPLFRRKMRQAAVKMKEVMARPISSLL